ncbi:MAG: hypothetical protein RIB67_05030 [Miltoncostaeaceae bacterium]
MALVVALLTLESPNRGPQPALPASVDGQSTLELTGTLQAVAPERPAGSEADLVAARVVQNQFSQLPGMGGRVQVQEFEARVDGRRVGMQNVYISVPGTSGGSARDGVVVVAPRDTPRGVSAGASSTAVMLRLARLSVTTRHLRPHLFVSTDGSTLGHAGIRWFLERFSSFPISSVMVLDGLGDAEGDRIHVWSRGTDSSQALHMARLAEDSITRVGGRPEAIPGLGNQLARLAVPQTAGDQGPAVSAGFPAVTLSGREDSPLRDGPAPTAERLELAANAAYDLLTVLDQPDTIMAPDGRLALAGRDVRPTVARLALLLLTLPLIVLAVDVAARARRLRIRLGRGAAAVARRAAPIATVLVGGYVLVLLGVWPGTAAGAPPQPADVGFGLPALAGLLGLAALTFLVARLTRSRPRRTEDDEPDPTEGAGGLVLLALLMAVLWLASPYALLLALPAAHALLLASAAERVWQVGALAAVGTVPLLLMIRSIGSAIDSDPFFATWYLLETTTSGARGAVGPLFAVAIGACLWAMLAHALERAREIALAGGAPRRRRRPRLRLSVERVPVGRRRR